MKEAVSLLLAQVEKSGMENYRVYKTGIASPMSVLAMECEFENLAKMDVWWGEVSSKPDTAAFVEKWDDLQEHGETIQIWNLLDRKP
jgi:hypothetical protein